MICTDTDNYVNVNYKERNKKPCSFKVAYYFTELAAVIFFLKSTLLNAQKHLQRSHSFIVNVLFDNFSTAVVAFFSI